MSALQRHEREKITSLEFAREGFERCLYPAVPVQGMPISLLELG
jgi:hypothetical protein